MAEHRLRQDILKRIHDDYPPRKSGVLIFGRPASGTTGAGHPDLFGVAASHAFFLEIKLPKVKPTPIQIQKIMDLRMCGGYAWVIRSTLDATRAVYVAKRGGPVPTTDEPIDFDDWFKSVTSQASPVQEGTVADPDLTPLIKTSEEMLTEPDFDDAMPYNDDVRPDPEPEPSAQALEEMPEVDNQGARRGHYLSDFPSIQEQADLDQVHNDLHEALVKLDRDLRAVGDRVTEVYEQGNRIETGIRGLRSAFNKLMSDIDEPELEVEADQPESNGAQEQPAKRGRGRPRKVS